MSTDNVFNIKKFVKEAFPEFRLSAKTMKPLNDLLQTVTVVAIDHAIRNAKAKEEKTILPRHLDWDDVEDFKEWIEHQRRLRE